MNRCGSFQLFQSDAVEWLRSLPSESVDLVVTDPPYESLEKHRAIGTTTRLKVSAASSNEWFRIFPNSRFPELFAEVFRVLRKHSHFYLVCDPETAFIAKPVAEAAGFRFWKPLVWDKCVGPNTPVWTDRGVVRADAIVPGDRVASPNGRLVHVLATRRTSAPVMKVRFSDGLELIAAEEHRFVRASGELVELRELRPGDALRSARVQANDVVDKLFIADLLDDESRILELPDTRYCLFCGRDFESSRAAAAHQARFCDSARSKEDMAAVLGVSAKRLRRWMSGGSLPAAWAKALGLEGVTTGRSRAVLQNDSALWLPESIPLDYEFGRIIGLFAAEGTLGELQTRFALHRDESTLAAAIGRFVAGLGMRSTVTFKGEGGAVLTVPYKMMGRIVSAFVGGNNARTKFFKPLTYAGPAEFRAGVLAGLLEGDGNWSHEEQRETLNVASIDLAMFALRCVREKGIDATIRRFENDHAGGYRVRFNPKARADSVVVESLEAVAEQELIDIAVDDPDQLYLLGDGIATHNCTIGMGYHYRARYEFVLFFEKGKRRLKDLGVPDIITVPRVRSGYPAEKPVALSETLIRQSTEENAIVVDPFMGSGSTGVAALALGRRFAGNDLADTSLALARRRLIEAGGEEGHVLSVQPFLGLTQSALGS